MPPIRLTPTLILLFALGAGRAHAQDRLTLGEALARADQHAYGNRMAEAGRDLASADRDRTLRGLLPTVRTEAGWMRTTDPLNAFGFTLRQRAVSEDAFDPARLNAPDPRSNISGGVVTEVPLINPDVWLGRSAAAAASRAANATARWTRQATRLDVARAYYGGLLAREQVAALAAGHDAARSHVRRAELMLGQGLVTRSDLLLAEVRAGEVETQLVHARGLAALSARQLAMAIGLPDDTAFTLPASLPPVERVRALADQQIDSRPRADVEAAHFGREAARRDVRRATGLLLPRVNSFARWDWNDAGGLYAGRPAWTVGVMASWSVFSGAGELVERRAARARSATASAMAEAADARARLEVAERGTELEVALASLLIAERAVGQAEEAARIVARKYEGGLATVTELLDASAVETRTRLELAAATYRSIIAVGAWRLANGYDVTDLTVLDRDGF
jgi:outer membrane protein